MNLVCSPDIKNNDPFYNNLLVELTNFAAKESVNIIPLSREKLSNGFTNSPTLVVGRMGEEDLNALKERFKTIIAFENYVEHEDLNQIYFDHYKIGWNAVKALAEYGHKKVIHLTGPNRYAFSNLRRNGFVDAALKSNVMQTILSGKMNFQGGYRAGGVVANLIRDEAYTAVFVANDWMAVGLIQYLKEFGMRVPEDVSIIGVDNIALSSQISPSLTTFALDMRMMVAEVFVLLNTMKPDDAILGENPVKGRRVILTPVLVTRDSIRQIGKDGKQEAVSMT